MSSNITVLKYIRIFICIHKYIYLYEVYNIFIDLNLYYYILTWCSYSHGKTLYLELTVQLKRA